MTDNIILEGLQKFLTENVASKIKLQKPNEKDVTKYELVNPSVHIGWIPPKLPDNFKIEEQAPDIPCLIVGMDEGDDDGEDAGLGIRIAFVIYNIGEYDQAGRLTPSFQGYKDLVNLIVMARRELAEAAIIEGVTSIERPFKWGMYQDQPYPYWYGWLTFRASCAVMEYVPTIEDQYM